jgi:hypothetical protein
MKGEKNYRLSLYNEKIKNNEKQKTIVLLWVTYTLIAIAQWISEPISVTPMKI